jgi:hypothetical protein
MKKLLTLMGVLLLAACAAPPTNSPTPVATNRNDNSAASPPPMTEADATAKEKAIWEAIKQKDYDAFAGMLADDQIEVLPEGVMDKASSISGVKEFEPSDLTFTDWKFLSIDKNAFIVAYTVAMKGKYRGKEFPEESARASSAWAYRGGKWVAVFHQETQVAKPMPMPAKPATAKAGPSPAPSTATTGPDVEANEKLVWDLFKAKNYDAFAALLTPDFLEVEADNYYDKAASVKGVSMFDASKAVLSDWKTVKLDDDAAIVNYVVKGAGPPAEGQRHSSIWVLRDGKWMGLFHHGGTPVRKPLPPPPPPKASPTTSPKASPTATAK